MKKNRVSILIVFICAIITSCGNTSVTNIPDYPIALHLNLTTNYVNFKAPCQYYTFEKIDQIAGAYNIGFGGVIVNMNLDSQYCAFDMACPHEKKKDVRVRPDESGVYAICEQCGSTFDLAYGTGGVQKGPSKEHLKRYRTNVSTANGISVLHVSRWQ